MDLEREPMPETQLRMLRVAAIEPAVRQGDHQPGEASDRSREHPDSVLLLPAAAPEADGKPGGVE